MAQEIINLGADPNDDTGDDLREGGEKINNNFSELYGLLPSAIAAATLFSTPFELWTDLQSVAGEMPDEIKAQVSADDTGTHTDPITGPGALNAGIYQKQTGHADPVRIGDLDSTLTAAILAQAEDFQFDAPAAVGLLQSVARGGRASLDKASMVYTRGLYFDFGGSLFVRAGVNANDPNHFPALTATRASTAYALNNAGVYTSFAINTLRVTDRGALIEAAATQLCSQPVDFSNAAWVKTTSAATGVAGGAPDGTSSAYDLSETVTNGAGQAYMQVATASQSAGTYTCSVHLKRGARRYAGILLTIPVAGSAAWVVDFDAANGPSIAWATGGGFLALDYDLIDIGGGYYRAWVTVSLASAGAINMRVQGFGGPTYAERTYSTVATTIYARAAFAQIEAGATATSPILAGAGTRSADVVTLALPPGNANDRFAFTWEGGADDYRRSDLVDEDTLDLVTSFGAPWAGYYIQRIELLPALDERLLAAAPSGGLPWLVAKDGTFALNGKVYANEAEIALALGAAASSTGLISNVEGYVSIDAVEMLPDIDFTVDQQGFTTVQDATAGISGGYLTMAIGVNAGLASALGRKMVVEPGKAYKFSATFKASASGGVLQAALANRADFGGGTYKSAAFAGTADTALSVVGASGFGDAMYVGMYHLSGSPVGLVGSMKSVSLVETSPGPGFPSGNLSIELTGTAPGALPSAAQVLAQVDGSSENDRWRIEWATDGTVHLKAQIVNGSDGQSVNLSIGSIAASSSFHLIAGMSSSALRGAVAGSGAEVDVMLPVGSAALRFGRDSANGSQFQGTVTGKIIHPGVEPLEWMKNRTKAVAQVNGPIAVAFDGDSWSGLGTGFAPFLAEQQVAAGDGSMRRRFTVVRYGVGSTTMAQQAARIIANASLYSDCLVAWVDGSENGHVDGQWATEFGLFEDVVAAIGHSRILWIRNGQIPAAGIAGGTATTSRAQSGLDMDNLCEAIRGTYGPSRVFDGLPIWRSFLSGEPGSAMRIKDESDVEFGYIPRELFLDGAHLKYFALRAAINGLPGLPGLGDALAALARS